ncbi:MAG: DNA repair protein RecO [Clostridiales bacterium]|nr:DNA repair protein RecO [Clostridiales bacterium]
MNKSVTAIVLRSEDYRDYDKILKLFTQEGQVMRVIIRGVKKSGAKLRFAAQPFAFCNYELSGRNEANVITGAMAIEDLFKVSDYDIYSAGCIMLEAAEKACEAQPNPELFVLLLKRLKVLIYGNLHPKLPAISYIQNAIHKSGYAYTYDKPKSDPTTVMELLACTENLSTDFTASEDLIYRTFNKIASRFEDKFSCTLVSKSFIL